MVVYDSYGAQQFYFPNILKYDPDQFGKKLESNEGAGKIGAKNGHTVQEYLDLNSLNWMGEFYKFESFKDAVANLASFYENENRGGGLFIYDPECERNKHNGITIISPEVKFNNIIDWLKAGKSQAGKGCWIKKVANNTITSDECGCIPDGDNPVDIPYFESWKDIDKMKRYNPANPEYIATDNYPMLQAMCDLNITNIHITQGNYKVSRPLEYSDNSKFIGDGYKTFLYASTDFDDTNLEGIFVSLFVPKDRKSGKLKESVTFKDFYTEGQHRYYAWEYLAEKRAFDVGAPNEVDNPIPKKLWAAINDFGFRQTRIENVGAAFWRYFNASGASSGTVLKSCKSWYMLDDGYTSTHEDNNNIWPTWGNNHHYEDCEAWFAGFGSAYGSSGFEADDGPDNLFYENCRVYFCPRGFNSHLHQEMTNVPVRRNYTYSNCKVYGSYIEQKFSDDFHLTGDGSNAAFGAQGGLNGGENIIIENCIAEDSLNPDIVYRMGARITESPLHNLKCHNFNSKIDPEFVNNVNQDLINKFKPFCIYIYFEGTATGGGYGSYNIVFDGNSKFDGGQFKTGISCMGANDIYIGENVVFDNVLSIGRLSGSENSTHTKGLVSKATYKGKLQHISNKFNKNPNCLIIDNFYYTDCSNSVWDFNGDTKLTTAIRYNDERIISANIQNAIFQSGSNILALDAYTVENIIFKSNTINGLKRAISYGSGNLIGSENENILINTNWNN